MSVSGSDRIPPYNIEAERAVIGACLLDSDALAAVMEGLAPEDFYDPRYKIAFEIISSMYNRGITAVDSLTFKDEMTKQGQSDRLGGTVFIASVIESVPTTANIEYHVQIVREKSVLRNLITVGTDIARMGYQEDTEVAQALEKAEQRVFEVARFGRSQNMRNANDVVSSAFSEIERRLAGGLELTGVPTGFTDFDKLSGGLQPGGLYILAARPSMGKTALAINIAQHAAIEEGVPVLIFSLEMSSEQIAQRMISAGARVNLREMFSQRNIDNEEWRKISETTAVLKKSPIVFDDSSVMTPAELRARCRRFFAKQDPAKGGLIVLDYLQLMEVAGKSESRQQDVSTISRALKAVAREFSVPVLALSQLSREVEKRGGNKKPQLSDLRDSGAIEQDADMVMFIYREAYYAQEDDQADPSTEVIVAKHRNGPTGVVNLVFFKEYARFENRLSGY